MAVKMMVVFFWVVTFWRNIGIYVWIYVSEKCLYLSASLHGLTTLKNIIVIVKVLNYFFCFAYWNTIFMYYFILKHRVFVLINLIPDVAVSAWNVINQSVKVNEKVLHDFTGKSPSGDGWAVENQTSKLRPDGHRSQHSFRWLGAERLGCGCRHWLLLWVLPEGLHSARWWTLPWPL